MESKLVSTADVPPKFLKAVMLVGSVPFKALRNDQRISYTLYVPPEHYNPDPKYVLHSDCKDTLDPVYQRPRLPLLVNIHGTGRSAEKCRDLLIPFANTEHVAVLAPLYPGGIDSDNDLDNYKVLRYKSLRSDIALLDILDEVATRWPGIATEKVFMMGFSGGGQFVHRFMYLYPDRLHAVSVGAPGRVTYLDLELKWPKGIQNLEEVFGKGTVVEKAKVRALRGIQLVVGNADNSAQKLSSLKLLDEWTH
jgi:predicted peptidase